LFSLFQILVIRLKCFKLSSYHFILIYFWILHPVVCIVRTDGNTISATVSMAARLIISYCRYMFWSFDNYVYEIDRLCGLVVRILGYRSGGPGSIPGTTREKKVVGLERGPLILVSTTEELLDRKVAAPV
jgi:hypothetical protein